MATIISIIRAILLKPASDVCVLKSKIVSDCGLESKIINEYKLGSKIIIDDRKLKSRIANNYRDKSIITQAVRRGR